MNPPPYRIEYDEEAIKKLAKIGDRVRRAKIVKRIESLATDPFPANSKPLQGDPTRRIIRFSSFRIIYEVVADTLVVYIWDAGPRGKVYDKYDR